MISFCIQQRARERQPRREKRTRRTLMVKRLYGNMRGIKLKKLSSYSFSVIALSATAPSNGRIANGNLPFGSQFSINKCANVDTRVCGRKTSNQDAPFEMATLRSSIAASSSGWKGCCEKRECQERDRGRIGGPTRTMSTTRRFFFPFGLSTEPLVLRFPELSSPSDKSAIGVSFEPCECDECDECACVCK